jgi:aspartyl protease
MRISKSLSLGVAAFALSSGGEAANVSSADKSFVVPFEFYKGHIYVTAFLDGNGPLRFVVDTGASGIGRADQRLVAALSLRPVGHEQNSDGINSAPILLVSADSLRLGGLEKRHVTLASRDYNGHLKPDEAPVMGIIGRDFFRDRLLTIDYPARTIRFTSGRLRPGDAGVVAYKTDLTIPVCFAIGCFDGRVDSGSGGSLIIPKSIATRLRATAPVPAGSATAANTHFSLYREQLLEAVRISGVTAANQKILYSDPSDKVINIGSDFLKDYVLTIDQRHHLLKISRPQPDRAIGTRLAVPIQAEACKRAL